MEIQRLKKSLSEWKSLLALDAYKVLFEDLSPSQGILELMGRELVDEHPI